MIDKITEARISNKEFRTKEIYLAERERAKISLEEEIKKQTSVLEEELRTAGLNSEYCKIFLEILNAGNFKVIVEVLKALGSNIPDDKYFWQVIGKIEDSKKELEGLEEEIKGAQKDLDFSLNYINRPVV